MKSTAVVGRELCVLREGGGYAPEIYAPATSQIRMSQCLRSCARIEPKGTSEAVESMLLGPRHTVGLLKIEKRHSNQALQYKNTRKINAFDYNENV